MLRAITLDFWDTLYQGASEPARIERRREALFGMVRDLGHSIEREAFDSLYRASGEQAMRWWRDEQRGYQTDERIRWILTQLGIERPAECAYIAAAVETVDRALLELPPPFLPGARELLARLSERYALAIVSDTGFASGRAQDQVLVQDGVRGYFTATVYSMDIGHCKPRPEIFHAALEALGVRPEEALHVGDIERTDVAGALGVGMRAVRLDAVRDGGATRAEHVARSLDALASYLLPGE